eukprot:UN12154
MFISRIVSDLVQFAISPQKVPFATAGEILFHILSSHVADGR